MSKQIEVGDVVVIRRAMFRGRFIVVGFETLGDRRYAHIVHESHRHEDCRLLVSNLVHARDLIEIEYDPMVTWSGIQNQIRHWVRIVDGEVTFS